MKIRFQPTSGLRDHVDDSWCSFKAVTSKITRAQQLSHRQCRAAGFTNDEIDCAQDNPGEWVLCPREGNTQHTPGPWTPRKQYANRWIIERKNEGCLSLSVAYVCTTVCEVGVTNSPTESNARLIAAAPALLAACEDAQSTLEAVNTLGDSGLQAIAQETMDKLRNAIAEARQTPTKG